MDKKFTIIEDQSPYFIRFQFDNLTKIIDLVKNKEKESIIRFKGSYIHKDFPEPVTKEIISLLPVEFGFDIAVASIFETLPGGGSGIHKDGKDNRISFNIIIKKDDNECITYWYNNEDQFKPKVEYSSEIKQYGDPSYTRNIYKDHKTANKFDYSMSMIAQENEMILFNTEIFHSWKNNSLKFSRKVLTLRIKDRNIFFDDAKKTLNF
jgi:hypothetical protein